MSWCSHAAIREQAFRAYGNGSQSWARRQAGAALAGAGSAKRGDRGPDARRALAALGAAARTDDRCGVAQLVSPGLAEAAAALASAALALQAYTVVAAPPRFGGRGGAAEAALGAPAPAVLGGSAHLLRALSMR